MSSDEKKSSKVMFLLIISIVSWCPKDGKLWNENNIPKKMFPSFLNQV
jgi:hypothetical protein